MPEPSPCRRWQKKKIIKGVSVSVLARAGRDGDCLYSHCLPGEITIPMGRQSRREKPLPAQGQPSQRPAAQQMPAEDG